MMGSHHQPAEEFEVIINKTRFEALPAELQAILRYAAFAASSDQLGMAYDRYPKDLEAIRKRGVNVVKTGEAVLKAPACRLGPGHRRLVTRAVLRQGDRLAKGLGATHRALASNRATSTAARCSPPTGTSSVDA